MCTGAEGVQVLSPTHRHDHFIIPSLPPPSSPPPLYRLLCPDCLSSPLNHPLNERSVLSLDVALDGLRENSICTFAVCSARYKTRPGLVYHYGHSHSTSSGDPAKELSPSPAEVEPRSVADTAASNQPGWSQNQLSFLTFL